MTRQDNFAVRFAKHKDELEWLFMELYHNPGVLALVRKRGEETLVGLFNFTEYPAGASLDALGGEYHTPEGTSVWLADVELEPYQALLVRR
jgi:amylosucrase